ncbi:MAG: PBECR2 nuclease fold domain-containing protein, partial [Fimbriimonadales bacterium]|nr:PBECR2 nuclease fold domain-containing protein [Fimbriimonadales bacterium]
VNDPIWKRWSPPCGHRCRCTLRQVSAAEARRRGGVTPNLPAEGGPDEGWGNDPRDAWLGLERALRERLDRCRARAGFAKGGPVALPRWCEDGPIRDQVRMLQAWIARKGEMPEPRPLTLPVLPRVQQGGEGEAFALFMEAFGGENAARLVLPSGDVVVVSDELFRFPNGRWKLGKRERDKWLLYLPEVIKSPDEIWRLDLAFTEEL